MVHPHCRTLHTSSPKQNARFTTILSIHDRLMKGTHNRQCTSGTFASWFPNVIGPWQLISQLGSTMKSPRVHTATSQYPCWYILRYCQGVKLQQPTNMWSNNERKTRFVFGEVMLLIKKPVITNWNQNSYWTVLKNRFSKCPPSCYG